jgi:hypothetical protein
LLQQLSAKSGAGVSKLGALVPSIGRSPRLSVFYLLHHIHKNLTLVLKLPASSSGELCQNNSHLPSENTNENLAKVCSKS